MKKKIQILLASALLVTTTACEGFLQKDPLNSPSQSIFWQKKSDFESALAGCYSQMYAREFSQIIACFDALSDNAIAQFEEETYGSSQTIAQGDLSSSKGGFVTGVYSNAYKGIARIHILMENLDIYKGGDISAEERQFILAQCKALRGYYYSWLFMCYKEVPIVTSSLDMGNMYQPKATRAEVLDQIMSDYNDAINELPDKLYTDAQTSGRMTVSAVKALKAKVMMFDAYDANGVADATKMKEVVSLLQTISGYSLDKRTRDNFLVEKQASSPEIMFSVRYLRPNLTNSLDLYYGAWEALEVTRDLLNTFECKDGLKWGESDFTVRPDENILYSASSTKEQKEAERKKIFENRDRRLYESVSHSRKINFPDPGYEGFTLDLNSGNESLTGYSSMKLLQPTKEEIGYSTISDADVIIMRYAHVLLMIAEAENEANGATAVALNAINEVRARSGQPEISLGIPQNDLRERIRNEWRVETCFEGWRYFQLKQWRLMDKLVNGQEDPGRKGYIKVYKPEFEFFPIPQSEIDKAGGILVQDPAYK